MTPVVETLGELLIQFAHQRISAATYIEAHRKVVRKALITLEPEAALRPYLPRLIYYCLECEDDARTIVRLTHEYIVGERPIEKYVEQLRSEFAVLDRRNFVPWAYGIRSRHGASADCFSRVIDANAPIDPGKVFRRRFRTTMENQQFAHIELVNGEASRSITDQCTLRFLHRVRLPPHLPHGQIVEVGIERVGERGLKLSLRIPTNEEPEKIWWWTEISDGFWDLAAEESHGLPEDGEIEEILMALLQGGMRFLNSYWNLLQEEDAERLADWIQHISSAIARRDEKALQEGLDLSRHETVVFVLDALLTATSAPRSVRDEFERLAQDLLKLGNKRTSVRIGVATDISTEMALSNMITTYSTTSLAGLDIAGDPVSYVFHLSDADTPGLRFVHNVTVRPSGGMARSLVKEEVIRGRMIKVVRSWYSRWNQEMVYREEFKRLMATEILAAIFLKALVGAESMGSVMLEFDRLKSFQKYVFRSRIMKSHASSWYYDESEKATAIVDEHLQTIDHLQARWQQDVLFHENAMKLISKRKELSVAGKETRGQPGVAERRIREKTIDTVSVPPIAIRFGVTGSQRGDFQIPLNVNELLEEVSAEDDEVITQ